MKIALIICVAVIIALCAVIVFLLLKVRGKDEEIKARHAEDEEKLKFLLNVSHELKTPLTLVIGPLERVIGKMEKDTPEYTKLISAKRQAMRMRTLILTVLDSHKIEEGVATLNPSTVKLNDWVDGIAEDFRDEMKSHHIELQKNLDEKAGLVDIDCDKLVNVLTNMFINALKHSPNGTKITVGTSLSTDGKMIRVFVSDEGDGLGGVDMTRLFTKFYQGHAQKTGSGLGLAYAYSIVKLHNGDMGAYENKPGKGSTFYFDIPA